MRVLAVGHRFIRHGYGGHAGGFCRRYTEGRIFKHQALPGRNAQAPCCREEDIRRRLGRAHLRVISSDDGVEQVKPLTMQGGLVRK